MALRPLTRLRKLCLAFPEAHEVEAWGEPTFRVRNKIFAMYAAASTHHGEGREAIWIKALPVNQEIVLRSRPKRYFKPPYVGPSGWIGAWIDKAPDWEEIAGLLEDAYRLTAPKSVLKAAERSTSTTKVKGAKVKAGRTK